MPLVGQAATGHFILGGAFSEMVFLQLRDIPRPRTRR
jgi:hypothetical protein